MERDRRACRPRPEPDELGRVPAPRKVRLGHIRPLGHAAQIHADRGEREAHRRRRERLDHHGVEARGLDARHRARREGFVVNAVQRRRRCVGQSPQHLERAPPRRVVPLGPCPWLRGLRLGVALGAHHRDRRLARAGAVDPSAALDHRVERGQIHDRVIGIEIDPDLARRGRDQIHRGLRERAITIGAEPPPHRALGERGPLASSQRPGQQRHPPGPVGAERAGEPGRDARRVRDALDEHRDRARAMRKRRGAHPRDAPRRRRRRLASHMLRRVQAPAKGRAREVLRPELEWRVGGPPRSRRQRHGAERLRALKPLDRAEQRGERRRKVRLVEHHQRIVPEQPRVQRAHRAPVPVAREQQP